jgi:hypothetical protein
MKKIALSVLALIAVASMALASGLNQFKAGDISFSILDKDALTPLASASIKLISSESGDVVAEATADEMGQAVVALDEGRYLLNISDINLAVFDVSSAEGISACRVIMPDAALLVGGQDDGNGDANGGGATVIWPVIGGIAAFAIVLGGTYWAIEDYQHHTHHRHRVLSIGEMSPVTPVIHNKPPKTKTPSST